ncbi:acyltransferase [Silvimonas sp.]|uniref:LpxL/LpxP family acyltransferase n=1 Tax=Silvimonas sp. TaxID=2650811 RepID=UPI00284C6187|nr:acyltransferase [Silvimonas sp.]MDR3427250.1 acyltransferase [Silvimonas sp.]
MERAIHWSKVGEAGFVSGMKILFTVYRWFGRWPFRVALYPVLAWYVATRPDARAASRDYLNRLHQDTAGASPAPTLLSVLRHFGAFAETLLDKLLVWSAPERVGGVHVDGGQPLIDLLEQGKGGVIVASHIGNFELCRAMAKQRRSALKLTIFTHTRHAQQFNRLMRELAPDSQVDLIQVTDLSSATAVLLSERVERGEFVVIAGDRVPVSDQGRMVPVDFLGCPTLLPMGPYLIASILKCPLLVVIASKRGCDTHITIRKLADPVHLPRADRTAGATLLAQQFADLMAAECHLAPLQWFNFFPFWAQARMTEAQA